MADTKLTGLTATTTPVLTDYGYVVTTPGGTPASHYATLDTLQQLLLPKTVVDGRLTLTTGTPVTTADVTAATTLYFTPYRGNKIGLYDGTNWHVRTFAELSITLASLTASRPYDVWCYDNSGTPALELLTWSSTTARGTALAYQDGVLVKSGAATRRYIGTICITVTTGQCEDSLTKRFVWNYYNRVSRALYQNDATASWNYATAAWQQARNTATNQVEIVCGSVEDALSVSYSALVSTNANSRIAQIGIGVNSVTVPTQLTAAALSTAGGDVEVVINANITHLPALGYSYYAALERPTGSYQVTYGGGAFYSLRGGVAGLNAGNFSALIIRAVCAYL